jgi:hypothetical protein
LASRLGLVLNYSPYQKREEIWCGFGFFQNGATESKLSSNIERDESWFDQYPALALFV